MIKHIASFLICSLLLASGLQAKKIGIEISYAEFMNAKDQSYLELYFALSGSSIDYVENNGGFSGGVQVTVALMQDSLIVAADKFNIKSPVLQDTSDLAQVYINQVRLPVEPGTYTLSIDLQDLNEPEEKYHIEQGIETALGGEEVAASNIMFLESYSKADAKSQFSKSGYDLVPWVNSGSYYFPQSVDRLNFYMEIYNTAQRLGEDEDYLVKYYLRDADNQQVLNDYASFAKKKAGEVEPILASFNIENLPTGNYELVVEAINKEQEPIISESNFFYRNNPADPISTADYASRDITGTFVDNLGNIDSLYEYIQYLYPISTDGERRLQKNLLAQRDITDMKRYFYTYWAAHSPNNPQQAWKDYYKEVRKANELFGTGIRKGYMSDRGRVFLMYGRPDFIDERISDPNLPPYMIWQYNRINTPYTVQQTNKIFVFAEFNPSTNDYELFHSTAVGELSSRRWRYDMALKYGGANGDIDDDFRSRRDEMGNRFNNNILLNSTGSDRDNR